jgi:hypothetical protein
MTGTFGTIWQVLLALYDKYFWHYMTSTFGTIWQVILALYDNYFWHYMASALALYDKYFWHYIWQVLLALNDKYFWHYMTSTFGTICKHVLHSYHLAKNDVELRNNESQVFIIYVIRMTRHFDWLDFEHNAIKWTETIII